MGRVNTRFTPTSQHPIQANQRRANTRFAPTDMAQTNVEADPMFQLLTDALRAGPGSPEWHQAVGKLRAGGMEHGDEYQMLIDAREHLESGKEYRSVRAGAGFTRKLLDGIDREEPQGGGRAAWMP